MQLESERDELISAMNAPDYYSSHSVLDIKTQTETLQNLETEITQGYQRWEELENKKSLCENNK